MENLLAKTEDGQIIDRELNPPITFLRIEIPRNSNLTFLVNATDRQGKQVGFLTELTVNLHIKNGMTCTGKRFLRQSKSQIMVDAQKQAIQETFTCPCILDGYEVDAQFVAFDPSKNPTNQQLKDSLGCRICGRTTDVMFRDKDGAKCEKHRGQATEILMLDKG